MGLSPPWGFSIISAAQEITSVLGNQNVHYCFHNSPLLVFILSQINLAHGVTFYFRNVGLNIILPSKPSSSRLSPSFRYTYKIHVISSLSHRCHMPYPSYPPWFDHIICGEEKKIIKLPVIQISPDSYYLLLGLTIYLSNLFSNSFCLCSLLNVTNHVSHSYNSASQYSFAYYHVWILLMPYSLFYSSLIL